MIKRKDYRVYDEPEGPRDEQDSRGEPGEALGKAIANVEPPRQPGEQVLLDEKVHREDERGDNDAPHEQSADQQCELPLGHRLAVEHDITKRGAVFPSLVDKVAKLKRDKHEHYSEVEAKAGGNPKPLTTSGATATK